MLDRAIVENHWGIKYNGQSFRNIEDAKEFAEKVLTTQEICVNE